MPLFDFVYSSKTSIDVICGWLPSTVKCSVELLILERPTTLAAAAAV